MAHAHACPCADCACVFTCSVVDLNGLVIVIDATLAEEPQDEDDSDDMASQDRLFPRMPLDRPPHLTGDAVPQQPPDRREPHGGRGESSSAAPGSGSAPGTASGTAPAAGRGGRLHSPQASMVKRPTTLAPPPQGARLVALGGKGAASEAADSTASRPAGRRPAAAQAPPRRWRRNHSLGKSVSRCRSTRTTGTRSS